VLPVSAMNEVVVESKVVVGNGVLGVRGTATLDSVSRQLVVASCVAK
jgi:hypothetical protein